MPLNSSGNWPPEKQPRKAVIAVKRVLFAKTKEHLRSNLNGLGDIIDIEKLRRKSLKTIINDNVLAATETDMTQEQIDELVVIEEFDPLGVLQYIEVKADKRIKSLGRLTGNFEIELEAEGVHEIINNKLEPLDRGVLADFLVRKFYRDLEKSAELGTLTTNEENDEVGLLEPEQASHVYDYLEGREEEIKALHDRIRNGTLGKHD